MEELLEAKRDMAALTQQHFLDLKRVRLSPTPSGPAFSPTTSPKSTSTATTSGGGYAGSYTGSYITPGTASLIPLSPHLAVLLPDGSAAHVRAPAASKAVAVVLKPLPPEAASKRVAPRDFERRASLGGESPRRLRELMTVNEGIMAEQAAKFAAQVRDVDIYCVYSHF